MAGLQNLAGSAQRVMLVEDEDVFARAVVKRLQKAGFDCETAGTVTEGRTIFKQFAPDLILLDMRLPDGNGMDLLPEFVGKGAAVIVMTAHGDVSDAVTAIKQGATDYLKKPIDLEELLLIVEKSQRQLALKTQLDHSRERNQLRVDGVEMIGESAVMLNLRKQISQIAKLSAVTDAPPPTILISGETGTGKDVAARLLHQLGVAADRPFVQVDCASLPAELIESELFGHEKGAFTNAQGAHCGLIEAAEDGTLFLDEVGELPLNLQAKLLNVLERRMVRRLGSTKERPVAARFIAATNRDLQQMLLEGRFRADLFYRLNVLTLEMPALKQRGQDVAILARYFLSQTERRYGLTKRQLDESANKALTEYLWPGNVRELRHLISRAALLSQTGLITAADLGRQAGDVVTQAQEITAVKGLTVDEAEKLLITQALNATAGNVSKAAHRLGLTRMAMRYRIEKHSIRLSS